MSGLVTYFKESCADGWNDLKKRLLRRSDYFVILASRNDGLADRRNDDLALVLYKDAGQQFGTFTYYIY